MDRRRRTLEKKSSHFTSHFSRKKHPPYFTLFRPSLPGYHENMAQINQEKPNKILRLPAVLELIQLSRSTVYAMLKNDDFPKPLKLGPRARAWRLEDVENWLEGRRRDV